MDLQATPWGPSPYRTLGEKVISLAKSAKASSVALMLPSSRATAVPEGESRRHEHVHDTEKRVGDSGAVVMCMVILHPGASAQDQVDINHLE
jgi:hypothetical protein